MLAKEGELLRESEERFKKLYQESPIPTFTWQKNGDDFILVNFNYAAIQMSDGKVSDHLGDSAVHLYKNRPKILSDMNLCFRERSVVRREIASRNFAPGRFLSVHYGFIPPDLIIVHTEDQTDRKRAEEVLQESESKLRALFESANDAIFLMDQNIIIDCNPKAWAVFGRTREHIIGQILYRFSPEVQPDGRKSMEKADEKIAAALSGQAQFFEWKHKRHDGSLFDAEVSLNTFGANGKYYLLALVRDITERKRAEEEIVWKTAFLEAQVEATIDGILVVDEKGQKILANQHFLDIWQVPQHIRDDKDDTSLLQYVMSMTKYPEQFLERVMYLYEHPTETSNDEIEFKDGMVLDRYSSPVLGKDGKYYGRIWTFRDITERKRSEKEREKLIIELRDALSKIKTLSGMLPICSSCKKIRDDRGYWNHIESYIKRHSEAEFSHGICPECAKILYPEHYKEMYPEYDE